MPNHFKISIAKFMHVSIELPTYIALCDITQNKEHKQLSVVIFQCVNI